MGGCSEEVISPPESPKHCANGGVLEPKVMQVHHTSRIPKDNQLRVDS